MMVMMTVTVKMIIMCITKSRIMISVWDDVRCRYQAKKPRDDEDRARRLQTNGPTDQQTNGPTDRQTDKPAYRDARTHLKSSGALI